MQKVAAITGAYGGLGAELSKLLARKGYALVLGGRNAGKLQELIDSLGSTCKAIAVVIDVTNPKDCEKFVNTAVSKFGRLDLLINNAGTWKKTIFEELTPMEIQDMFVTNAFGPMYCSQVAVKIMKKQNSGHILNIGSTAGVDYMTGNVAYGSAKAALIAFTACLGKQLNGTGIKVTAFSPGAFKTEIFKHNPEIYETDFYKNAMLPEFVAKKVMKHIENPKKWHVVLQNKRNSLLAFNTLRSSSK